MSARESRHECETTARVDRSGTASSPSWHGEFAVLARRVAIPAPPAVTVASYVLADLDTGAVLAARAPHERQRPASTLKILTSLVALRTLDPDQVVDGTAGDLRIVGIKVGIGPGGRYTVRRLLQGLLLNSGK